MISIIIHECSFFEGHGSIRSRGPHFCRILKGTYLSKYLRFHRVHRFYEKVVLVIPIRTYFHFFRTPQPIIPSSSPLYTIASVIFEFPQLLWWSMLKFRVKVVFVGKNVRAKPCCGDKISKLSCCFAWRQADSFVVNNYKDSTFYGVILSWACCTL